MKKAFQAGVWWSEVGCERLRTGTKAPSYTRERMVLLQIPLGSGEHCRFFNTEEPRLFHKVPIEVL